MEFIKNFKWLRKVYPKRVILFTAALFLCLGSTNEAYGSEIEVELKLLPPGEWKKEEQALIEEAAKKVFKALADSTVANCGYRYAEKENKNKLRKKWGNSIPVINKSRKVKLTINKKTLKGRALGQAKVGVAGVNRNNYTIEALEIDLSSEQIYDYLKDRHAKDQGKLWVNVIAHEVAHNLGFSHGSSGNWSTDYPGYFATEIGFCAMNEGQHGYKKKY